MRSILKNVSTWESVKRVTLVRLLVMLVVICVAKVMAADQVEVKAEAKSSLNEPSEKDGGVRESQSLVREQEVPGQLSKQLRQLQESLALANAEAEFFSRQWKELRLKNQMLGVDVLTGEEQRLQERVVQAVKELYQTGQERRQLVDRLNLLINASQEVLKSAEKVDPQKRAEYEVALRSAREFLAGHGGGSIPLAGSLQDGQIVHVNLELNSVILNLGTQLAVKPGMPFRVRRGGETIGRLKVFQVREQVCAAFIERLQAGVELKVGDLVEVAAEK